MQLRFLSRALAMWVGARQARPTHDGRGADARAVAEKASGPTDSQTPTEKNWPIGRHIFIAQSKISRSQNVNEMPM